MLGNLHLLLTEADKDILKIFSLVTVLRLCANFNPSYIDAKNGALLTEDKRLVIFQSYLTRGVHQEFDTSTF